MLTVDDDKLKQLESDLKTFAGRAFPFATKATVNRSAFETQKLARNAVERRMTLRNRFTIQSIQVDQARTLNVQRQRASVGSTADYMEDQEFGTVKRKQGKEGVSIATGFSAGQEGQKPRTRLPRGANKLASIRLRNKRKKGSRKQRNYIAVMEAAKGGQKYIFMNLGKRKGIFKVTGGKRQPKVKMAHDLSRPTVVVHSRPWLGPAVNRIERQMPAYYEEALTFQLKRAGLFRGR